MALYQDLPVYRDTYRWVLKIHEITREFPRDFKPIGWVSARRLSCSAAKTQRNHRRSAGIALRSIPAYGAEGGAEGGTTPIDPWS
jgi:hypothetical protein